MMSADTYPDTDPGRTGGPLRQPGVRVAVGYGFAADPGAEADLERQLRRHAGGCGLHLNQVLIDTPGTARRALDGLVADLARRQTRHILVPDLADLGDDGTGWLVGRVLESEFRAVVHTFPEP
jgi:hypothetical protein